MKRIILLLLILTSLAFCTDHYQSKNILVLHSYHKTMSWVENIDKAIEDVLKPKEHNYILHIEYMDTKKINTKKYMNDLKNFYIQKYHNTKFDLILSSDDNAYDFLRKNRDTIFGKVPVVFSGVDNFKEGQLKDLTNFTGVIEDIDAINTIKTAKKLFPNTKNLFVINDFTKTGKAWKNQIQNQIRELDLNVFYSKNDSFKNLQEELQTLPENTLVLLGVYFKDKNGVYFTYERIGSIIAENSNAPVFCLLEFNLQNGILGGKVISGYAQGKAMTEIGKRILQGKIVEYSPKNMSDTNKYVFDANALKTYNINESNLPKNSIILNKKVSFYEKHKVVILNATLIILFLLIIIVILLKNINKRKLFERRLYDSRKEIVKINKSLEKTVQEKTKKIATQDELKKLYLDTADVLLIVFNTKGEVTMLNKKGCELLEVEEINILGKNWFEMDFLPKDINKEYKKLFFKFVKGEELLKAGHFEHKLISKTGQVKLFTWTNTLLKTNGKIIGVICSALDITEKKEQENIILMQSKITAVGEIFRNIAHHWRQPLASIAGQLATMKLPYDLDEEISKEEMLSSINSIYIQCEYLSQTVDNFRSFFMADSTKIETINLKQTISKVEELIEDSFADNNIQIVQNIEDCQIELNESTFIDSLLNIFNNTKDAIIKRDIDRDNRYIFIDLKKEADIIKLNIFDNAGGIKEDIIDKVFEPYCTTKDDSHGTGIGLYMTNQIITKHLHGTISVDTIEYPYKNKNFKGALFTITLPVNLRDN